MTLFQTERGYAGEVTKEGRSLPATKKMRVSASMVRCGWMEEIASHHFSSVKKTGSVRVGNLDRT